MPARETAAESYFAHSTDRPDRRDWEPLEEHLRSVEERAGFFAREFGAMSFGRLVGLWHDLGKYAPAFQEYLLASACAESAGIEIDLHRFEVSGKVDHSSAGAQHAVRKCPILGHLLASAIAGHHSGLLDARADGASLEARLRKALPELGVVPESIENPSESGTFLPLPPPLDRALSARDPFGVAFFARMLFSCLVDGDFLETERFLNPRRSSERPRWNDDILIRVSTALAEHVSEVEEKAPDTEVNRARRAVREACIEAAPLEPGFFSLTVPTGGGKTLASLSFALEHAKRWGFRRVIYVIPFTSIIEQNAKVFREVTARATAADEEDPILEHHSNLAEGQESESSRLATENWDAPIVVTTSVQLFESLFANRTSACRKLHNLAGTVVVLDEAQTLPVDVLQPCVAALKELVAGYGSSVLLCTATQPALMKRGGFSIGIEGVREIVSDPPGLYDRLRRVAVTDLGALRDAALLERLDEEERILCIVNTRGHARKLAEEWSARGGEPIHLSALMCPAHRSVRLDAIRGLLRSDGRCRVVSTQLVEAGVDLDFPVVYRALAGIDAIAQAAGRCNREGKQRQGHTYVFRSEHTRAEAYFRDTAGVAAQVMELHHDPLSLEAVEHYFRLYYWEQKQRWDRYGVLDLFHLADDRELPFLFGFATAAERFRIIEENQESVIVPWGKQGRRLCESLRRSGELPPRQLLRALQSFTVNIPKRLWERHVGRSFELVHDLYPVLSSPELHYSDTFGLQLDEVQADPLIA